MKIHPREARCTKAANQLEKYALELADKHELTDAELFRIVHTVHTRLIGNFIKEEIRIERHGDVDQPGGLATQHIIVEKLSPEDSDTWTMYCGIVCKVTDSEHADLDPPTDFFHESQAAQSNCNACKDAYAETRKTP